MSERGSGSGMDYLELKRRHDNYKNKQRTQNAGASRPLPGDSETPAQKAESPVVAAPIPAAAPAAPAQPVLRRGAVADEPEMPREIDLGEADEEKAADVQAAEEIDVGEPEEAPAPQDSQNPFNQFFVAFGKAREYMNARREKKRAAREEIYDETEDDLSDEPLPDEDLGDEPEEDAARAKPAGALSFLKRKKPVETSDAELDLEDLPEEELDSQTELPGDDGMDAPEDDEDWDDEDAEDEPEKKKLGFKGVMRLFVRPADEGKEAPEEDPEDAFNIDFEGFDEPFMPPISESEKVGEPAAQTGGDFTVDERNDTLEEAREAQAESAAVSEAGLSRRERRELAMKRAQEQASAEAPADVAVDIAAEPQTEQVKVEPATPAPIQTPAVPSIFDEMIPESSIAVVDEPTKEFKPVHAEEIALPDEEEEPEPEKKGIFGRRKSRRAGDEEDTAKKGRASRRFDDDEDDEDEDDRPKKKKSRKDDYDDEDEYDRPKKKSRKDDYDDEDEYDRPKKKSRKDDYDDEDEYDRPKKKSRRDDYDDEDEDDYDEPRRSRRHDDIDYDDYDYNDDDGAGHGFVYHLTGFFKVVFAILIVLLALILALNVWDYIGDRNGKDSPVDTMREHLRGYAPGVFDTLFPISVDGEEPADPAEPADTDGDIGLGDGWDTPSDEGDAGNDSTGSEQPLTAG